MQIYFAGIIYKNKLQKMPLWIKILVIIPLKAISLKKMRKYGYMSAAISNLVNNWQLIIWKLRIFHEKCPGTLRYKHQIILGKIKIIYKWYKKIVLSVLSIIYISSEKLKKMIFIKK